MSHDPVQALTQDRTLLRRFVVGPEWVLLVSLIIVLLLTQHSGVT